MDNQLYKINRTKGIMKLAIEAGFCEGDLDMRKCDAAIKFFELVVENCAVAVENAASSKSDVSDYSAMKGGGAVVRWYGDQIGQTE